MNTAKDIPRRIRTALASAGDPDRAVAQQRYMKSQLPYHGVVLPQVRALSTKILRGYAPLTRADWEQDVRALWDDATHREERYAAIILARHRSAHAWQDPAVLALYRHTVVTGAWWDLVDEIAAHLVGGVLAAHREVVTPVIRRWAHDRDLWVRRSAVLCQLQHKSDTDQQLLLEVITANVDDPTFWMRKAIGWALRQYARTDPGWVHEQVSELDTRLSGLSRREALKHIAPAALGERLHMTGRRPPLPSPGHRQIPLHKTEPPEAQGVPKV